MPKIKFIHVFIILLVFLFPMNAYSEFPYCDEVKQIEDSCKKKNKSIGTCIFDKERKEYERLRKTCLYYTEGKGKPTKTTTTNNQVTKSTDTKKPANELILPGKYRFEHWDVWVKVDQMTDEVDAFMMSWESGGEYLQLSLTDYGYLIFTMTWNKIMNTRFDFRIDKNTLYSPEDLLTFQDHKTIGVDILANGKEIKEMKGGQEILIRGLKFQEGFVYKKFSLKGFTKAYNFMASVK